MFDEIGSGIQYALLDGNELETQSVLDFAVVHNNGFT
jgi:hypothetical protein